MPGTYSQILVHVVFSTKHREQWIKSEVAERLYPYIGGIVRAEKGVLYDIGGYNPPPRWGGSVNSRTFPRVARRAAAQRVLTGRRNRRQDLPVPGHDGDF